MKTSQYITKAIILSFFAFLTVSCSDDDNSPEKDNSSETSYFIGLQIEQNNEVIVPTESLTSGTITGKNIGMEQTGWMYYFSYNNKIFSGDYRGNKMLTSYSLKDGALTKGEDVTTDLQIFANTKVDDKTLVAIGSEFDGSKQELYIIDTETMAITKKAKITIEVNQATNLSSMPNDLALQGNKLFVSFVNVNISQPRSVHLPEANIAKIAVFNYPELTLDKIITDTRCPNIGRYASSTVLEEDENGDIYMYATSSILSGMVPVTPTNSGVLRIKKGTTEFDKDFHIDFEAISNGYKINDLYYVANGKAVVRVVKEDEAVMGADMAAMVKYGWGAYAPVGSRTGTSPQVYTGILDLKTKSFNLLSDVKVSGGSFFSPVLIEGTKAYIGVSTKDYANIYVIDTEAGTAIKGAEIEGDYAKGILKLTE